MNTFLKILLYIFSIFIILNVILFLYFTIHFYNQTKDLNESIQKSVTMLSMIYVFLFFGVRGELMDHNYKP